MKKQLQGIALILYAILMTIQYGHKSFFDFDFGWSMIFNIIGIVGVVLTFWTDKKK